MTKETITLAQISDLHLGPPGWVHPRDLNLKRGLGALNWWRSRHRVHRRDVADLLSADMKAHDPDHIAVTGDLVNIGLPGEFQDALKWIAALGSPEQVSVIPGNHDIYTKAVANETCLDVWAPYLKSDRLGCSLSQGHGGGDMVAFPFVRQVGPVALIALNSARPTPPFVAAGRLGEAQLNALGRKLSQLGEMGLARVVLIHHPPLPGSASRLRALEDAVRFSKIILEHGAELILHGHNHRDSIAWMGCKGGHVAVSGAASGSAAIAHKGEPLARYYLFTITRTGARTAIERVVRGLAPDGKRVVEIERSMLDHNLITK